MNKKLIFFLALGFMILPMVTMGQETVKTFHQLPFLNSADTLSTEAYVDALYRIAISVAAVLVVLRLIYAGVKYMFSEVITNKAEAKKDIMNALLGLLIILGAVTILNTINPNLARTDFLRNATTVTPISTPGQTPRTGNVPANVRTDTGARSCGPGETLHRVMVDGHVHGTCVPTNPDAPRSGDLIRGGGGSTSQVLDQFGTMAAFNAWCAGKGGVVRNEEVLGGINYTCRYP